MLVVIIVTGLLKAVFSLSALINPNFLRKSIDFYSTGNRLYLVGCFRLVLGILLLGLANQARWWGYAVIIGLITAASGVFLFFIALKRTKKLLQRLHEHSNLKLRFLAISSLIIWTILIYSLLPALGGCPRY